MAGKSRTMYGRFAYLATLMVETDLMWTRLLEGLMRSGKSHGVSSSVTILHTTVAAPGC